MYSLLNSVLNLYLALINLNIFINFKFVVWKYSIMKFFWNKIFSRNSKNWEWKRMKLEFLTAKYNINPLGIAHIGGWKCIEVHKYFELYGNIPIVFVEANEKLKPFIEENINRYEKVRCEYIALGNKNSNEILNLNFSNPDNDDIGQSSSILEPLLHPPIGTNKIEVKMTTANNLLKNDRVDFLAIDVQGYELEVLKGASELLSDINFIITEVNKTEQYNGCALISDLDNYLKKFDFIRVETEWWGGSGDWGDAFYIKKNLLSQV